jgi:glucosyl-3-phosphoglycerate synthase
VTFADVPWTLSSGDYSADAVLRAEGREVISVIIPAQNEALTIGSVLDAVRHYRVGSQPFVDEIIVVDDHSRDDTATVAERHGRVVDLVGPSGEGEAMAYGLKVSSGSLLVFLDADVTEHDRWILCRACSDHC